MFWYISGKGEFRLGILPRHCRDPGIAPGLGYMYIQSLAPCMRPWYSISTWIYTVPRPLYSTSTWIYTVPLPLYETQV